MASCRCDRVQKKTEKESKEQNLHTAAGYGAMIKVCKIGRKGCVVLKCRKSSGFFALDDEIDRRKRGCVHDHIEKSAKTCGFLHEMWAVVHPHIAVWKSG